MASILIRTLIIYILLTFTLRIMGKRQIGELDVGDLVSTLLISEIAAIPIDDPDIPLLNAIVPILFIFSLEVILSTLKNKSERVKRCLDGESVFIIYKGRLLQSALKNNRISINELLSAIRGQGVGDIKDVEYALVEQNGSISVIEKNKGELAHAVVIDGEVIEATVKHLGYNEGWLDKRLGECGAGLGEIFLMTVTDKGDINIIYKDKEK